MYIWEALREVSSLSPEEQVEFLRDNYDNLETSLELDELDLFAMSNRELISELGVRNTPRNLTRTMLVLVYAEAERDLREYFLHLPFSKCLAGFILNPKLTSRVLAEKIIAEERDIQNDLEEIRRVHPEGLSYIVRYLVTEGLDTNDASVVKESLRFWDPVDDKLMSVVADYLEPGEEATLEFLLWCQRIRYDVGNLIVKLGGDELQKIIDLLAMIGERIEDHVFDLRGKHLIHLVLALARKDNINFDRILSNEPDYFYSWGLVKDIVDEQV